MHNLMPTPFFFTITTIGMNHGNVEGLIIFVGSSPSLWSANFSWIKGRLFVHTEYRPCISNIDVTYSPFGRLVEGRYPSPSTDIAFYVIYLCRSISSGVFLSGSGFCVSSNSIFWVSNLSPVWLPILGLFLSPRDTHSQKCTLDHLPAVRRLVWLPLW